MTLFQMDFFIFMLVVLLFTGGVFVMFAGFASGRAGNENEDDALSQKLDVLTNSVSEADEVISELSDMSKNVLKEFESKYQELLFLYNLIDEKQKKLGKDHGPELDEYIQKMEMAVADFSEGDVRKMAINSKFANVLELREGGSSVEEIARQLNMGKGEISLILNLTGGGGGL